jgi:F-type H+-transporting ATPase subunit b
MFVTEAFAQSHDPAAVTPPDPVPPGMEEGHVQQPHEPGFPPFNGEFFPSQLLWLAITFGIFYYMLKRTILPQIASVVEGRRTRVAADLDAAEKMRADADAAHAAYEQELGEARNRSHAIAAEARDKSKADAEAERKRTEGELDARLDAAQARIAEIKRQALADVGQIATDVAQSILTDVARIEASPEEVSGAVAAARR